MEAPTLTAHAANLALAKGCQALLIVLLKTGAIIVNQSRDPCGGNHIVESFELHRF